MSGGVDSSVVAYLLSQQYPLDQILGIHMSNWEYYNEDDFERITNDTRCWEQDWKDAQSVARHLQLDLKHVSFQKHYWNYVFEPYCHQVSSYNNHETTTPNPDVACNRWIKFGVLKDYLYNRYSIQRLATGHYARLWDRSTTATTPAPQRVDQNMPSCLEAAEWTSSLEEYLMQPPVRQLPVLLAAKDGTKDQSYFLCTVPATAFSNVIFPLGDYYKKQRHNSPSEKDDDHQLTVRELAQQAMLPNASKKDSMGICFVGKRNHGAFLNQYIAPTMTTSRMLLRCINIEDGSIVATVDAHQHPSLLYATIGQGAKLSGATQKWFVVDKQFKNDDNNTNHNVPLSLMLCPGTHHPALYSDTLFLDITEFHWIMGGIPPPLPFRAKCRIRHMQPLVDCEIDVYERSQQENDPTHTIHHHRGQYIVHLTTPLRGIARGQICALYAGGGLICLGGGPIAQRGQSYWELQRNLPPQLHPAGHNDLSTCAQSD